MDFPVKAAIGYYAAVTLVTFCLYAWDKASARNGGGRVRERTLHAWTWLGGFFGALAGQMLLRHKTRHVSFMLGAWLALVAHAGAWWWLASR